MKQKEEWKPVLGFEDKYEVSNLGRVRSLDRWVEFEQVNGKDGQVHRQRRFCAGQVLRTWLGGPLRQRNFITLSCGSGSGENVKTPVSRLVYAAHVGPLLDGEEFWVAHKNRVWNDDRADNLEQLPVSTVLASPHRLVANGKEKF